MKKMPRLKKAIIFLIAFLCFIVFTNPTVLFFLPASAKDKLLEIWSSTFGDVTGVTKAVTFNWISIFKIIAIVLLLLVIYNFVKYILEKIKPKTGKGQSLHSMTNSITVYAILLIGLVWCLSAIGINLSTIFASIGIVALIVGFAAESLIEDVITGIFLVFEDEFNIGDVIEFNGFRGTVISIGVRTTCIQDNGGNIKIVNNSDIRNVLNRSKAVSRAVCDIPTSYAAKLEDIENVLSTILTDIQAKYPDIFTETPEYLGVQELGASSVNLRVVATVSEKDIFKATRIINREVKLAFDREGVEIPFQQVVVHNGDK